MRLSRFVHVLIVGALGGASGWGLLQVLFYFHSQSPFPLMDQFVYEGIIVGLGLGALINAKDAIFNRNAEALIQRMLLGGCFGAVAGFISFTAAQGLLVFYFPVNGVRLVAWIILGLCIGGFASFVLPPSRRIVYQIVSGGIGGLIGGILFELSQLLMLDYLGNFLGLVLIGMSILFSMALIETWFSKAYIRVLSGTNEGQIYFLDKDQFSIGYAPQSDIVLTGYAEICEKHARVFKQGQQCFLQNTQTGGQVLINYRLIHQQAMKKGDIIKIGTALLQYCEL